MKPLGVFPLNLSSFIFKTAYFVYITIMVIHVLTSFSVVQIYSPALWVLGIAFQICCFMWIKLRQYTVPSRAVKKSSNCGCRWNILYWWLLRYTFFACSCSTPRTVPRRFFKQKPQVSTPNKKVEESKDLQKNEWIFRSNAGNLFKENLKL